MQSLDIKDCKLLKLHITQTRHHQHILDRKKCLSSTPVKKRKYLSNEHKMRGAHFQCVNIHYAKFEYKGMKIV